MDGTHTIGTVADRSGLTPRALRLYDGVGLLRPASVDPQTGYRLYSTTQIDTASVIAALRSVEVPLETIRAILQGDPSRRQQQLDDWWTEEEAAMDNRRKLVRGIRLTINQETTMNSIQINAGDLIDGLSAVLRSCSTDDDHPALKTVRFEPHPSKLRLVASDSFRLSLRSITADTTAGDPFQLFASELSDVIDKLTATESITIQTGEESVQLLTGSDDIQLRLADTGYPNYRPLLDTATEAGHASVDRQHLLAAIPSDDEQLTKLAIGPGGVSVLDKELAADVDGQAVEFILNTRYLREGLETMTGDKVDIAHQGEGRPVRFHNAAGVEVYLLMPIHPDMAA